MWLINSRQKLITVTFAATILGFAQTLENSRDLSTTSRVNVTKGLTSYPDDLQIFFYSNLKCGACIRGGYIYCVNGYEEDLDLSKKASTCC